MARKYTKVKLIEEEAVKMRTSGKTNREVAEHFNLEVEQVKELLKRRNRAKRKIEAGIIPRRPGRPPKGFTRTEEEKDNEIKRLKMENELLRDFLLHAGRR
jgi:orotate phosphoribosyltransferase-like protein